jgi:putative spermidine/putrescine transport system ATP-binding protein
MAAADRLVVMSKGRIRQIGTARDIYETPSDLFVAGFIGQANLLRGAVRAVRDTEAEVALVGGDVIVVRHDGSAKIGDERSIALRPEDFELGTQEKAGVNNIRGTVARMNYLGASINAGVRVGESTLMVSIPRGRAVVQEGEAVFVSWPKSAGIMLAGTL